MVYLQSRVKLFFATFSRMLIVHKSVDPIRFPFFDVSTGKEHISQRHASDLLDGFFLPSYRKKVNLAFAKLGFADLAFSIAL